MSVISDLKILKDDLYLGSSLHIYKRSIGDLNTVITGKVFYDVNQNGKPDSTGWVPGMRFCLEGSIHSGYRWFRYFQSIIPAKVWGPLSVYYPWAKATNGFDAHRLGRQYLQTGCVFDPKGGCSIGCLSGRTFRPGFIGKDQFGCQ
ncbi:MAG: hypothetical protein IPH94_21855 [Saprospiraceae bacterium]|nr:hypothetical protein [Saprospiraceae bacterium]